MHPPASKADHGRKFGRPSSRGSVKPLDYWIPPKRLIRFEAVRNMPKQKTHKGTKKRFRLSASGKVKHRPAGTSHLATRKDQKRIRKLRGTDTLAPGMVKAVKRALAGNSY